MEKKTLTLKQRILEELNEVNKSLAVHNGSIEFISIKNKNLVLEFKDACAECQNLSLTFNKCIKQDLFDKYPELKSIKLKNEI